MSNDFTWLYFYVVIDPKSCTLTRLPQRVRDVGNSIGDKNLGINDCLELCESTQACRSFVYVPSQNLCHMKDKTLTGFEQTTRTNPDSFTVYKKCDIGKAAFSIVDSELKF